MAKTFVRLDEETISPDLRARILSNNGNLRQVERNVYLFEFDDDVFTHAVLLMGRYPNRFGYDLSLYLHSACCLLRGLNTDGFIVLDRGTTDFKRRASEDLGIAISSLFMVHSFSLKWETISQIPQNRKLSRYTPDFIGFTPEGKAFIYESKGTTRPQAVEATMNKALQQAKSYPENAENKLGIVSYFPNSARALPPFTFVADPRISDIYKPDTIHSLMLHFIKVLEFAGFEETRNSYEDLFRAKIKLEQRVEGVKLLLADRATWELKHLIDRVLQTYETERERVEQRQWQGYTFFGRLLEVPSLDGVSVSLFLGVEQRTVATVLRMEASLPSLGEIVGYHREERINVFPDGTLFQIEVVRL